MSARELAAAGITDPELRDSYELCRQINAEHGKTYYLATLLLPPHKRPYVHALYALARYADEIVDDLHSSLTSSQKADELHRWSDEFLCDLKSRSSSDPIGRAVVDTVNRWDIPHEHFEAFFCSMAMDLTVTEYLTYDDLYRYVYGSAAVIGLQMVPILEPLTNEAYVHAIDLGVAFQLANFIRDVGEDLQRGRLYIPLDELAEFGLTRADVERGVVDDRMRAALRRQIDRVKRLEQRSRAGIDQLHPTSRPCIEAARVLYCGIVDEVERIDYQVFDHRATVPTRRRLAVALPAWGRALHARHKWA
ncbi:MAG TPA: phytoene/squalene synthase family protein [Actinomycetes bacterium]|nr:phytoene/squalene synthase family protein [Actinomycetes bacterium]